MRLHLFNPEHDLALAADKSRFTAPHAARQLRSDLAFIPAFWASPGDAVLVNDAVLAREQARRLSSRLEQVGIHARIQGSYVEPHDLSVLCGGEWCPWGWDRSVRSEIQLMGAPVAVLPSDSQLSTWRELSHRRLSVLVLSHLKFKGMVGESMECFTEQEIDYCCHTWNRIVIKAPWSSSGRGVRFVDAETFSDNIRGWIRNTLSQQGSVMIEPYYNKVKDFGMEFMVDSEGKVGYCGLSLFSTTGSAYTGNLLATEYAKEQLLMPYLSAQVLSRLRIQLSEVLAQTVAPVYQGPIGVDMMVVTGHGSHAFLIHPCVEINLRCTMGHLALALSPRDDHDLQAVMNISFDKHHYHVRISDQSPKTFHQHVSSIHDLSLQ